VVQGVEESLPKNVQHQRLERASGFAEHIFLLLKDVYDGKEVSNSFHLATEHLSSYRQKVVKVTSLIPLGYAISYGAIAKAVGGGPRAVGGVMASNPFPPIVPCHRVVRSNLTLGGYGGGLDVKLAFLKRERRGYSEEREFQVDGKKLKAFPVEFVLRKLEKG
jgi:methylated-DNA-[protein]-cysteine S-methyltransferase